MEVYPNENLDLLATEKGLGDGEKEEFAEYVGKNGYELEGMSYSTLKDLYDEFVEDEL